MTDQSFGINSVADRRYYHFVLAKTETRLPGYWKELRRLGDIVKPAAAVAAGEPDLELEHRKLKSERAYARGIAGFQLSQNGNNRPPFLYDLFAATLHFRSELYMLLGFPFVALARNVIDELLRDGFIKTRDFQSVEVGELLKEKNRPFRTLQGLSSKVVGVQFVVTDDKSLTAVRLGGNDPFHAQIYEKFLREKFESGIWGADLCSLACERDVQEKKIPSSRRILRSRVHIDKWGNFKFYAHAGCKNISLIPYIVSQVRSVSPFKQAVGNPLWRVQDGAE